MILLEKVCSGIGSIDILHDMDIAVKPGELVLVLGANGAGKTTLLRVISGIVPPWSGNVRIRQHGRPAGPRAGPLRPRPCPAGAADHSCFVCGREPCHRRCASAWDPKDEIKRRMERNTPASRC